MAEKIFHLTFDGAVDPPGTLKILEQLDRFGIKATFFVEGHRIAGHEDTLKDMMKAGHHLGNHSFNHPDFTTLTLEQCEKEVRMCDEALVAALGLHTKLLRPPGGFLLEEQRRLFESMGYEINLWTISNKDWLGPNAAAVAQRTLDMAHADRVIGIYHDYLETTAETVSIVVPQLLDRGYRFEVIPYPV